jgi:hypothetical protein
MITFLLDTKLGHLLLGLVCVALVGAGMYWRGHNVGWDHATARYKAVVTACMAANAQDAQTIAQLRAANDSYAQAAKVSEAELAQAAQVVATQHAASAAALKSTQNRLDKAIHDHPDAAAWAATPVPASIAAAIGVRQ